MIKVNKKGIFLITVALLQGSVSLQASDRLLKAGAGIFIADVAVNLGTSVGLGVAAIVKHRKKKKTFREYVETFRDMGYTKERAKIYAQMAINNPNGLEAVIQSIDQENAMKSQQLANEKMQQDKQALEEKMQETQHHQKMEQIAHEHKLNLFTYIALFLSGFAMFGLGLLLFRRR